MDLYKYYHKKNWTYKSNYSRKKKINLLMNLLSLTLASVGVITGGITLNPIALSVLSVIVSKDQARSTDRGWRIPSKFSASFLYQIRLRSVVFLVK